MYAETDYIMLSALQHYQFCPRQCALIHVEQQWAENRFTAEGQILHKKADSKKDSRTGSIKTVRTLAICSSLYGLSGQADVVEFHDDGTVVPVEYKRGRPKKDHCDEVQLCAQALCLEEMLSVDIEAGALFYGQSKRRKDITFDPSLRSLTQDIITATHRLIFSGRTPKAVYDKKCDSCSLLNYCMPKHCHGSVNRYLEKMLGGH